MVDYLRSCYRGVWRLNTDPAILTPGRFYFAPAGTPASPVGSLRGSRNYVAENGESHLEWGELDGKQRWDNGAPPIFVPLAKLIGTESCLADGIDIVGPDQAGPDAFRVVCIGGRDYRFPTIIYTSFSVAYHDREFTYYNDVPLTLVDATCEARYEGPTDIPNTKAVVRVTDVPDGSLATNFYLCDNTPPAPPALECCSGTFPYTFKRTLTVTYKEFPSTVIWTVAVGDIEFVWVPENEVFRAVFSCGGFTYWCEALIHFDGSCYANVSLYSVDTMTDLWQYVFCLVTCPPGTWAAPPEHHMDVGQVIDFCGEVATGTLDGNYFVVQFGPIHE